MHHYKIATHDPNTLISLRLRADLIAIATCERTSIAIALKKYVGNMKCCKTDNMLKTNAQTARKSDWKTRHLLSTNSFCSNKHIIEANVCVLNNFALITA